MYYGIRIPKHAVSVSAYFTILRKLGRQWNGRMSGHWEFLQVNNVLIMR